MSKPLLVIMGHGSRKAQANDEFKYVVENIELDSLPYHCVNHCFLELATPSLASVVEHAVIENYTHIDLYPLFFNCGNHVARDIPKQIQDIKDQYPTITIKQLDYFGMHRGLPDTIAQHVLQQTE